MHSAGTFSDDGRHRVAVLVRHGVLPLELGLIHQLFGAARDPHDGRALYEVVTCAVSPGEVRTDADFPVLVRHGPRALAEADTVLVPASHEEDGLSARLPPDLARALARVGPGARVASVCTGAFVLAAAGRLDGRPATTHWKSAERFRELHPRVALDPDVLYTDDGDVLTSAGEAAGIDLCLHMIRGDAGAAVAADVARTTVVPPHREGGQAQFVPRPVAAPERRPSSTGAVRAWALERLEQPLSLQELAERASMGVRTFSRRFREETGTTPGRWLAARRVERARQLLEETDLPVDRVADRAGLGTGASLRQHMREAVGVSPAAYRSTFRGRNGSPVRGADGGAAPS
ncbi:GlxA family transcriptional regulator [Streptomyces sp. TR06-5]|uniref:GlxA family transcriptional regulator n=1 Tax=unclassified Streptomyces TaxID=2593676 RepID=UPI00399F5E69